MSLDFTWDDKTARYRRRGRFIPASDVRAAVDTYTTNQGTNVADTLFNSLRDGRLNVRDLQLLGERQIAIAHGAAACAVLGGRKQMRPADWGRVGGLVRGELGHWRDLMARLADGAPIDGRVKAAFRAYFTQAGFNADLHEEKMLAARGHDEEKWVLSDGAAHCAPKNGLPSCTSIAARGWQPLGTGPARGHRACKWGCRCKRKTRNSATGQVRQ